MEWMNFLHDAVDFFLLLLAKLFFRREFDGMKKFFHFNIWKRNGRRTHLEAHTYTYIQKLFIIDRINSSLSLSLFRFLKKKNELEWMNPFVAYRENLMQWWRKISDFVNRTSIEFISRWRGFFTTDIWCWWMFLCLFLFFLIYMGAQFGFRHRLTAYILLPMPTSPVWLSWLLFFSLISTLFSIMWLFGWFHVLVFIGVMHQSQETFVLTNSNRHSTEERKKRTKWNKRKTPAKMIICCLSKERRYFKYVYNTRVGQSVQCVFHRLLYHKYTGCK